MITIEEFYKNDADNIILDLETYWTVQRDGLDKYIRVPFPILEELLESYENGLKDPYDDLADEDDMTGEEKLRMIVEQKERITKAYYVVQDIRNKFEEQLK